MSHSRPPVLLCDEFEFTGKIFESETISGFRQCQSSSEGMSSLEGRNDQPCRCGGKERNANGKNALVPVDIAQGTATSIKAARTTAYASITHCISVTVAAGTVSASAQRRRP